ncbi:MAG: HIT domain-containing protein [Methylococcales bacterium]
MNNLFQLHERLAQDCIDLGRLQLCRLLLMNDSQYPWFILVPERADVKEIYQLSKPDQHLLIEESSYLAENLAALYHADKMNVAAIGNLVPQLHVHHVVRYQTDTAWPAPIWGKFAAVPYNAAQLDEMISLIKTHIVVS